LACAVVALGQSDPQATAPQTAALESTTAFRADSTLVLVPVSVTDPSNRYVLGLEKEAFHLSEDNVSQTIRFFSSEDAPLSIGLLVRMPSCRASRATSVH
jgi:Ca-activated chloride channel family protein